MDKADKVGLGMAMLIMFAFVGSFSFLLML